MADEPTEAPAPTLADVQAQEATLAQEVAALTPQGEAPDAEPEPLPTFLPDPTDFPGEGFAALHYGGTESVKRAGAVFAPDSVVIVPESVAHALAGRENFRIVQESAESWPHFLAIRARARARAKRTG